MELPLRAQGSILAGLRGCDLAPKRPYDSTERQLAAYLRWCTMVPADPREVGVPGAYMQATPPSDWKASDLGHYPEHFYSHLMHAYQIVGYCHPDEATAVQCGGVYRTLVANLHLMPESHDHWLARMTEDRIASGQIVS